MCRHAATPLPSEERRWRHAAIGTLLTYADEHDREGIQRTLADLVTGSLTEAGKGQS
jgi:hypothetical protein